MKGTVLSTTLGAALKLWNGLEVELRQATSLGCGSSLNYPLREAILKHHCHNKSLVFRTT